MQHRELQGYEDEQFMQCFKKVEYLKGGVASGFKHVKRDVYEPRLLHLKGKKVLIRCDLNVPLDGAKITDDTRIRAAIPTLEYLVKNGAKVLVTSHLVRVSGLP